MPEIDDLNVNKYQNKHCVSTTQFNIIYIDEQKVKTNRFIDINTINVQRFSKTKQTNQQ
jgi:hypothetical protein